MKAMALALNKFLNLKETKGRDLGLIANFRIPDPWHPVTKHPECATMGGGKGKIAYWVTPVKGTVYSGRPFFAGVVFATVFGPLK